MLCRAQVGRSAAACKHRSQALSKPTGSAPAARARPRPAAHRRPVHHLQTDEPDEEPESEESEESEEEEDEDDEDDEEALLRSSRAQSFPMLSIHDAVRPFAACLRIQQQCSLQTHRFARARCWKKCRVVALWVLRRSRLPMASAAGNGAMLVRRSSRRLLRR